MGTGYRRGLFLYWKGVRGETMRVVETVITVMDPCSDAPNTLFICDATVSNVLVMMGAEICSLSQSLQSNYRTTWGY